MGNFIRGARQVAVALAFSLLWGSFAWGLPVEVAEGEAEAAVEDPWAGVKISDAYDELRCPYCGAYNELTAARCRSCGYEFPQPSAEYTYPPWVFVPGKGYYEEGTLLEPGKKIGMPMFITGLGLIGGGVALLAFGAVITGDDEPVGLVIFGIPGLCAAGVGAGLVIVATRTKPPVYALEKGGFYSPYDGAPYARTLPDSNGAALKIEVTLLGF